MADDGKLMVMITPFHKPEPPGTELYFDLISDFDEVKQQAFEALFPDEGKATWETRFVASDGSEIDDLGMLSLEMNLVRFDVGRAFVEKLNKANAPVSPSQSLPPPPPSAGNIPSSPLPPPPPPSAMPMTPLPPPPVPAAPVTPPAAATPPPPVPTAPLPPPPATAKQQQSPANNAKNDAVLNSTTSNNNNNVSSVAPSSNNNKQDTKILTKQNSFFANDDDDKPLSPHAESNDWEETFSTVTITGNLWYKGYMSLRKETEGLNQPASNSSWKEYWCMIRGHHLIAFASRKKLKKPDFAISLQGSAIEKIDPLPKYPGTFRITNTKHVTFTASAENEEDCIAWMRYMERLGCSRHVSGPVFGVNLDKVVKVNADGIPIIVVVCVEALNQRALDTVGLYRVSGARKTIDHLKQCFMSPVTPNVMNASEWRDVHCIASILKEFFREMPHGIIPQFDRFKRLLNGNAPVDDEALRKELKELPKRNSNVLNYILKHLRRVADNSEVNKMDASNLASVWGLNLFHSENQNVLSLECNTITKIFIERYDKLF